jgi:site-specific recombinase XerD
MNFQKTLVDYLAMRRGLGFKLISEGKLLKTFVSFLDQSEQDVITTEFALEWAKLSTTTLPVRRAKRLSVVRSFARYCRAINPETEVPPDHLLAYDYQRPVPCLFNDNDIRRLLQESQKRGLNDSFFGQTLSCLFGLLSVTGLRIGEALSLSIDDVDLTEGILTIRDTKFGKSRQIPLHSTTVSHLSEYLTQRDLFLSGHKIHTCFVNKLKNQLTYTCVRYHFNTIVEALDIDCPKIKRRPHLHDLRHYFARMVLLNWYRDGQDVERNLPKLSAYLGHVETRDTYWYLSACPELMGIIQRRLELHWGRLS